MESNALIEKMFNAPLFTFEVNDTLMTRLENEDLIIFTKIGIPQNILASKFILYPQLIIDDTLDSIVLGEHERVPEWKLRMDINEGFIFLSGQIRDLDPVFWFYNSSLKQLLLSLHTYNFFVRRLIRQQTLGNYHQHYEKYATLLKDLIIDIDEEAVKKGVWRSLIEEMSLGVI